jgi:hypothetical protein
MTAMIGRTLADDYTGVGNRGNSETKSQAVAAAKDMTTSTSMCVNMKVRVYGDAAVVTGLVARDGTTNGVAYKDR